MRLAYILYLPVIVQPPAAFILFFSPVTSVGRKKKIVYTDFRILFVIVFCKHFRFQKVSWQQHAQVQT